MAFFTCRIGALALCQALIFGGCGGRVVQRLPNLIGIQGQLVGDLPPGASSPGDGKIPASGVVFVSKAKNFPGSNGKTQIYVKDLSALSTAPVLVSGRDAMTPSDGDCGQPRLSADRSQVVYQCVSTNLPGGDGVTAQIYLKSLTSLGSPPALVSSPDGVAPGNKFSSVGRFSRDGSKVIFISTASNLPGACPGSWNVYYLELRAGQTRVPVLVSGVNATTGICGASGAGDAIFSSDSTRVAFFAASPDLEGSAPPHYQIYTKDLSDLGKPPVLVSKNAADSNSAGDDWSFAPSFAPNGKSVAFMSGSGNFPNNPASTWQIFIKDLSDASLPPALASGLDGTTPSDAVQGYGSQRPVYSPDGTGLAFACSSSTFPGATAGKLQIYLKHPGALFLPPVLLSSANGGAGGSDDSSEPRFTNDGRTIVFQSRAPEFPGANGSIQIYAKSVVDPTQSPVLVSSPDGVAAGTGDSTYPGSPETGN